VTLPFCSPLFLSNREADEAGTRAAPGQPNLVVETKKTNADQVVVLSERRSIRVADCS
jgi:hypothetical protein